MEPGVYEHFKGGRYTVLHEAYHSETSQAMVVYVSHKYGTLWVRPRDMFTELVKWPSGKLEPRFKKIDVSPPS